MPKDNAPCHWWGWGREVGKVGGEQGGRGEANCQSPGTGKTPGPVLHPTGASPQRTCGCHSAALGCGGSRAA